MINLPISLIIGFQYIFLQKHYFLPYLRIDTGNIFLRSSLQEEKLLRIDIEKWILSFSLKTSMSIVKAMLSKKTFPNICEQCQVCVPPVTRSLSMVHRGPRIDPRNALWRGGGGCFFISRWTSENLGLQVSQGGVHIHAVHTRLTPTLSRDRAYIRLIPRRETELTHALRLPSHAHYAL